MSDLTPRQNEIYDFIRESFVAEQRMPSFREICNRFGIKSPNGVFCHLKALAKKRIIALPGGKNRAIQLLGVRVVLLPAEETNGVAA